MITVESLIWPHSRTRGSEIGNLILDSIIELCDVDHGGNGATVIQWHRNAMEALQIYSEYRIMALDDKLLLGVAGCTHAGKLLVNYVAPAGVGMGVGKAMLWHMETHIKARGYPCVQLESSMAARHFYMKHGYYSDGPPVPGAGRSWNFPMKKWF